MNPAIMRSTFNSDSISVRFSNKELPSFARNGELILCGSTLFVYVKNDNTQIGGWYPLTEHNNFFVYETNIKSDVWEISTELFSDYFTSVLYLDDGTIQTNVDFEAFIENKKIYLTLDKAYSGKAVIFTKKFTEHFYNNLYVGNGALKFEKKEGVYKLDIDSTNLTISTETNTMTVNSNLIVEGNTKFNGLIEFPDTVSFNNSGYFNSDVFVNGNLTVNGSKTILNTSELNVSDNKILLNAGFLGIPTLNCGIEINRGVEGTLELIRFNESNDTLELLISSENTYDAPVSKTSFDYTKSYLEQLIIDESLRSTNVENIILNELSILSNAQEEYLKKTEIDMLQEGVKFSNGSTIDIQEGDLSIEMNNTGLSVKNEGVDKFYFSKQGDFYTAGDVTAYSDQRLKTDILKIEDALTKVSLLNGYTFLKIGRDNRSTGLIAQEVENVMPEAVITDSDGFKSVAYGNLVGLLIEAVKEQQEIIKKLIKNVK